MSTPQSELPFATGGFFFQHSNDLAALAEALIEQVKVRQRSDPLRPVDITVPHPGVGIWLKQTLAARMGACANLRFIQPTEMVWSLIAQGAGEDDVAAARALDTDALTLALCEILGNIGEDPSLERIGRYLQRAGDDDKPRVGLARELARVFGEYVVYRPDWIAAWSAGGDGELADGDPDVAWQRTLWQSAWERASQGARLDPGTLLSKLDRMQPASGPAVLLFGISHLPPAFLDVLAWVAERRDVHLFMPSPCEEYWGDERAERRELREELRTLAQSGGMEAESFDLLPNRLLGSLGQMGQHFLVGLHDRLVDQLPHGTEAPYRAPSASTRLGWLQRSLLELQAPEPTKAMDGDSSITIHACHSPLREVEVLHDQILGLLDPGPEAGSTPLLPRDIVVLAPDIDSYAPYIQAVFGSRVQGKPSLPFNISDRKPLDAHPMAQAFLEFLSLPVAEFDAESIVALLETPAIARAAGISSEDQVQIRQWVADLHIHWGVDQAHRQTRGTGDAPAENTWRHGLDRLLLGFACIDDDAPMRSGDWRTLSYRNIEGRGAEAAGRLVAWIGRLDRLRRILVQKSRTPGQWQQLLQTLVLQGLFRVDPDARDEVSAETVLRDALEGLKAAAERGGVADAPVSWIVVQALLVARLGDSLGQRRFLSRGITFANTVPLRAVPARVICMLGLNAGEFPRASVPQSFNLIERHRRPGDRSGRAEDRYLFLETLVAASDRLHLSFVGRDQQENNERSPSPLLLELLDYLERAGLPVAITQHALQPFSPRNFGRDRGAALPRSYGSQWLPAADAMEATGETEAVIRFCDPVEALPDLPDVDQQRDLLTTGELVSMLRSPATAYLRDRLHIRLANPEARLPDAHESNALVDFQLRDYAMQVALENGGELPPGLPDEVERLRAWMPAGRMGSELLTDRHRPELAQKVAELAGGQAAETRFFELELAIPGGGPIRLRGNVELQPDGLLLRWSPGSPHGKRLLPWLVDWLLVNACGEAAVLHGICNKAGKREIAEWPALPRAEAEAWLADLVALKLRGEGGPIPFFPKTAYAWETARLRELEAQARAKAADRFFGTDDANRFGSAERVDDAYAGLLTRGWERDDLFCGGFLTSANLVFGRLAELQAE